MRARDFFRQTRLNTILSGILTLTIVATLLASIFQMKFIWTVFTAIMLTIILIPPIAHKDHRLMLPWEILLLAAIPIMANLLPITQLSSQLATYFSIASLALIIVIELHLFTSMKINQNFALILVLISTLALGGLWSMLRYWLGEFTGQQLIVDNTVLMHEYVNMVLAGLMAGVTFNLYFDRRDNQYREQIKQEEALQ